MTAELDTYVRRLQDLYRHTPADDEVSLYYAHQLVDDLQELAALPQAEQRAFLREAEEGLAMCEATVARISMSGLLDGLDELLAGGDPDAG